MPENAYSAAASALGYFYQLRYALIVALRKRTVGLNWSIALESADDVELFGSQGHELHQLKHRAPGECLTNADPDLWKTIRVWSDGIKSGAFEVNSTTFMLVTTASVAAGSIAADLADLGQPRDSQRVLGRLLSVTSESTNKANLGSYASFCSLTGTEQLDLVSRIVIAPESPNISETRSQLESIFGVNTRPEYIGSYVERVEGWWFEQSCRCLVDSTRIVEGPEFDAFLSDLRDQFQPTNLPIDIDLLDMGHPEIDPHLSRTYFRQLLLVEVGSYRLQAAVHDFLRAYTQRSRWLREGFVVAGELARYERRLKEEWALLFHRWCDEMTPGCAAAEKLRVARRIYAWAEDADSDPIRRDCIEPFVTRGSLHMLAETQDVGWHPDYVELLRNVLEPATEGDGQ